ncbi:MAG: leucine-rich repeat domain-containing protein [Oscillospiraceae bacterium]|nr:leucine-rich repeat domain-containing protein [Oscillospiraceae bacterium]
MKKKIFGFVLSIVMVLGVLPAVAQPVKAVTTPITPDDVTDIITKYKDTLGGCCVKFWNTSGDKACTGERTAHNESETGCTSNEFDGIAYAFRQKNGSPINAENYRGHTGGTQCSGFADYLMYMIYGTYDTNLFELKVGDEIAGHEFKAGDLVRDYVNWHSFVIYKVEGDMLYYAECNHGGCGCIASKQGRNCVISFSRSQTKTALINRLKNDPYSFVVTPKETLRKDEHVHHYEYVTGYEAAHPHKWYQKCYCGEYRYTGAYETVSSCAQCVHVHSYNQSVTAPTCTAGGYTTYTCTCSHSYTGNATAALGHSWNDGNITTAAGCTTVGVKTYTCTRCSTTRTELVAAVGHSYQSVVTEPTYALGGYTTHTCTACGHSYRDGQTQPLKRTGTCGDGLTWELGGGTLTVSGGGNMYNYNNAANCPPWYEYRTSIQTVVVESGVTSVGSFAFCGCSNLVSVQLADSVTQISNGAFSGCTGLKQVKLPNAVTQIESETFLSCENLESITIPEGVTAIGEFAFGDCLALKSITIPRNVTSIGWRAFNNSGIETITFTGEAPTFDSNAFKDLTVVAFYSVKNSSWTSAVRQNYGGSITWEILDATEFSDWSTSAPPADAAVVESKTVYRYRSKQWKTTTNATLAAPWIQYGGDTVQYGPTWSLWSTNYAAKSAVLDVETKTQYHYFAFYSDSDRNPYTHATDLTNPKFAEIWVDNELPFYKNYDNIDLWGDSTTNVTTDMNGVEKTHLISKWIKVRGTKAATGTKYAGQGAVDAGYMSESECVYTRTVYRTRPITTTRQYWKWNDWSADTNPLNWADSLPASCDEYESATLYRYKEQLYTVNAAETEGGTITVDKIGGAAGEVVTVTATPTMGYELKEILVDGLAIEGNTFVITGDHIVSAVFEPIIYTIGAEGAANGTVMVDKVSGTAGAIVTVTAVPAENYVLKEILVDGQTIVGNTFAITGDHVVSAIFVQEVHTVTVGFIANGTVVADKTSGHVGEVVTLEVASNPGCMLKRVLVDGVPIGGNRFTITGNHVVTAVFVEIPPVNVIYKTDVAKTIIVNGKQVEICRWNWIPTDK